MGHSLLLVLVGLLVLGLAGLVVVSRIRTRNSAAQAAEAVRAAARVPVPHSDPGRPLSTLPAPVRRYLEHVLPPDKPAIQSARFRQRGQFRDAEVRATWRDFRATHRVSGGLPAFVWDASIRIGPGASVRVLDSYHDQGGHLWASLGGMLTVLDRSSCAELDEGELMRYLAEAPLYPSVLLPGGGVAWSPINDRSARATLEHAGTTASLVFHFNDHNEVERVAGLRGFMQEDGSFERRPWTGHWRNYRVRNGMRVPTEGQVAWIQPEGEMSYWKARVVDAEYQFRPQEEPPSGSVARSRVGAASPLRPS